MGQNILFTELENNQAIKNLQEIIKGVDDRFAAIKTNIKLTAQGKDSSFKSSIAIFPARTKSAAAARATSSPTNGGAIKTSSEKTEMEVKRRGYCNDRGFTAPNQCHICEDTGWTNTWVGTTTYNAVRQVCVCVGAGMMGHNYMKKTLENRRKICGYCNGSGMVK